MSLTTAATLTTFATRISIAPYMWEYDFDYCC